MERSWTIGARSDCDLVVDLPRVSGLHCRLTLRDGLYWLEDLNSTNGTYVNGNRINEPTQVTRSDVITLGALLPMPWPQVSPEPAPFPAMATVGTFAQDEPPPAPTPLVVVFNQPEAILGRLEGSDIVLAYATVSGRHARLSRLDGRAWIEDLGSSNGTYINGERIETRSPLHPGDRVALGSLVLDVRIEPVEVVVGPLFATEPVTRPGLPWLAAFGDRAPLIARLVWVGQVPLVLVAVLLGARLAGGEAGEAGIIASKAMALFGLGLAALWFGASGVLLGQAGGGARNPTERATRAGVAVGLGLVQCLVSWLAVATVCGLRGPLEAAWAWLVLAWLVGVAVGLVIEAATSREVEAWGILGGVIVAGVLLGGGIWPVARMPAPARVVTSVIPSRWAFEGLLLVESGRFWPSGALGEGRPPDLAERYFPVDTERMGGKADTLALTAMLVGLLGCFGYLAATGRPPIGREMGR